MTVSDFSEITKKTPEKSLLAKKKEKAGRNSYGRITVRHQGGGNRQKYRIIDFKRKKNATIATLILDFEDLENVSYRIQDDVLNNGGVVTNLKEILENETVEDLRNLISLYDLDNMQISVFLPKENQKE